MDFSFLEIGDLRNYGSQSELFIALRGISSLSPFSCLHAPKNRALSLTIYSTFNFENSFSMFWTIPSKSNCFSLKTLSYCFHHILCDGRIIFPPPSSSGFVTMESKKSPKEANPSWTTKSTPKTSTKSRSKFITHYISPLPIVPVPVAIEPDRPPTAIDHNCRPAAEDDLTTPSISMHTTKFPLGASKMVVSLCLKSTKFSSDSVSVLCSFISHAEIVKTNPSWTKHLTNYQEARAWNYTASSLLQCWNKSTHQQHIT